ncbi:dynein axonemal assembly factor 6 isoform X2 [Euwallacea fornicatus]|uniref:dynein axonemal assembly factor 6 isoform X2 n=1 Tax=Euwallacea fornicatus TaxID=995702 RepID=UPI00338D39DD
MTNISDIESLVELFSFSANDRQQDDEEDSDGNAQSNLYKETEVAASKKVNPYTKLEPQKRTLVPEPDEYENAEKFHLVEAGGEDVSKNNWKKTPKWDISYRQSVTASDVFLGMGFKTPATSSCENMVVTIDLPGENWHNVDLKIETNKLILISPKFSLELSLPHQVDPKRGGAKFDKDTETLVVTLTMDRELDLLNF